MQYKIVLQNTKQLPRQVQKELQLDGMGECQVPAVHQKRQAKEKTNIQQNQSTDNDMRIFLIAK